MQLQNNGCFGRNEFVIFVYGVQYVAVTGDFLLVAVSGLGFVIDDLPETFIRSEYALDFVGSLGALYFCNGHQLGENVAFRFYKKGLFPFEFMYLREHGNNIRLQKTLPFIPIAEFPHKNLRYKISCVFSYFIIIEYHLIASLSSLIYSKLYRMSKLNLKMM